MGFIIVMRNPSNNKLLAVSHDDDAVAEFETEDDAQNEAEAMPACRAWGYQILEAE